MEKKLPNIFANPIEKKLNNVQETFYGSDRVIKQVDHHTVEQKIQSIFASKNFVYKSRVRVITTNGEKNCVLVGRTEKSLLTLDNESILISSVLDIERL